ncbi:MAG TPA: homocysteine S-methyltransferase family protein, partial [Magnetospirillaceae bacterium]|nr:homocysteine S-methyltransferase family protein [Magnetospirillaceae bacterium]
ILAPYRPLAIGLNCSGGPGELAGALELLARASPAHLALMPNAGLPRPESGRAVYPMGPEEFAQTTALLVRRFGVALAGGCCGTGPAHIRALAALLTSRPAFRPTPGPRPARKPLLASLYEAWPREEGFLRVGEKANAAGSAVFSKMVLAGDVEGQAAFALAQEEGGAHALDLHLAKPSRDEGADLAALAAVLAGSSRAALCLDSADPEALAAALPLVGGRPLLNSASFEDRQKAERIFRLARRFGAAVVCLALDGRGPARSAEDKVRVCRALYDLALKEGLEPEDLYFDCLTFALASETGGFEGSAAETLAAIPRVKEACPGSSTILGVGNVSYGLPRPLRPAVTAVFLEAARAAGLDAAILDPGLPDPGSVDTAVRAAVGTLLAASSSCRDKREALDALLAQAPGKSDAPAWGTRTESPEQRLRAAILRGEANSAACAAREVVAPLAALVAEAMVEVGVRFSRDRMPLPLVLRSAEAAQAVLGNLASSGLPSGPLRGTVVLATVKGDLHDIGKNLAGLILSGSGYRVVDLGTDVPTERLIEAARAEGADAVGLSGLLTRSLGEMRGAALALREAGLDAALLLGGAAVDGAYVAAEIEPVRPGRVRACADAFEALEFLAGARTAPRARTPLEPTPIAPLRATTGRGGLVRSGRMGSVPLEPPFQGSRVVPAIDLDELWAALDRRTLTQVRWGYGRARAEEAAEALDRLAEMVRARGLCRAAGLYGYFSCVRRGTGILSVGDGRGGTREFFFPEGRGGMGRTLAKRLSDAPGFAPFFAVTVGPELSRAAAGLREAGAHEEYFRLHGLSAALAEAAAEVMHRRIKREFATADGPGRRYSFGFPGCPGVEAQGGLLDLLGAERIGLGVTEGHQLTPEFSVTAFVLFR